MTLSKAIRIARDRVSVVHYGRDDFVVQTWDPKMRATWESNHMDRYRAQAYAKAAKIEVALELLGIDDVDPNGIADDEGRWDALLRHFFYRRKTT